MKNMTKRDIADIVLVLVGITFIFTFLSSLLSLGGIFSIQDNEYFNKAVAVPLHILYLLILLGASWLLLTKRDSILNFLFPHADKTTIALQGKAHEFIKYSFWIKLLGIIICLTSGMKFISLLVTAIPSGTEYVVNAFWWNRSGPALISTILSLIVIWKADRIAEIFETIGPSNKLDAGDA